ncbi:hypothetical protein WCE34_14290 [Luteimonas sp. MJ204]|uniref:hypothetical protein n=1 Tax=Luteimonas sp. MJ145 TaxID=3129234 RepID=UPI0031BAECDA
MIVKDVWDDEDFAIMGWHDVTIWSMVASPDDYEFLMDMDYIFEWVHPTEGEVYYKFWIAPVTMIFENAHSIEIEIESQDGCIEIDALHRENSRLTPNGKLTQHQYRFECQEGGIKLQATGFRMFVRQSPVLVQRQSLSMASRGGVNFSRGASAA